MATPARKDSLVEILDLRHFSAAALRPLLEEEIRIWEKLLFWDYRSSAEMVLRYVDAKILPGYAAMARNGKACGYCFFVYEGSKGVVGDLYVADLREDPDLSGSAIERQLLAYAIQTLQQSPGVQRVEAQLLIHDAGTVAAPFNEAHFARYPRLFMELSLDNPAPVRPADASSSEIEICRWSEQDYQEVANVITHAYAGHVDAEINDQYRTLNGSLRFLNNIVRFPGCGVFDAGASFVAKRRLTHQIVGAILCSRVKDNVGHVTQVCVLPEYRGHGIGHSLLRTTSEELRQRHFSQLTLTVTEDNRGAVELYKSLHYTVRRVFDAFVWNG